MLLDEGLKIVFVDLLSVDSLLVAIISGRIELAFVMLPHSSYQSSEKNVFPARNFFLSLFLTILINPFLSHLVAWHFRFIRLCRIIPLSNSLA